MVSFITKKFPKLICAIKSIEGSQILRGNFSRWHICAKFFVIIYRTFTTSKIVLLRRKLIYGVVILISALAHVYVYQCACPAFTFIVLCIVNLIDISFLREGEIYFMEELIKRYFWKGYKYGEIILYLEKRHHVEISKRLFQRYVNRLGLFRKNLHIISASLLEDTQQYLEENGSSHGYRNVQQRLMSSGIQYSKGAVRIAINVLDPEGVSRRRKVTD